MITVGFLLGIGLFLGLLFGAFDLAWKIFSFFLWTVVIGMILIVLLG